MSIQMLLSTHFNIIVPSFPDDSDNDPTFNPAANTPNESSDENVEVQQCGKKRVKRVEKWKRNQRKRLRNEGKEYVDRVGKKHREKKLQVYNHNCRFKCNNNVSGVTPKKFVMNIGALVTTIYSLPL